MIAELTVTTLAAGLVIAATVYGRRSTDSQPVEDTEPEHTGAEDDEITDRWLHDLHEPMDAQTAQALADAVRAEPPALLRYRRKPRWRPEPGTTGWWKCEFSQARARDRRRLAHVADGLPASMRTEMAAYAIERQWIDEEFHRLVAALTEPTGEMPVYARAGYSYEEAMVG